MSRRLLVVFGSFSLGLLLVAFAFFAGTGRGNNMSSVGSSLLRFTEEETVFSPHRKLLGRESSIDQPDRIRGERCTNNDIVITQGPTAPLPSGIPTFNVQIMNACVTGCDISRIHIACGWFSSDNLVNRKVFKRLRYNDCLVNDGKPLLNGQTLSFQYANTFPYPFSVSSVVCP